MPLARPTIGLAMLSLANAASTGTNLGFEQGLTGWTHSGVVIDTTAAHEGSHSLDLQSGWVEQTLSGLTPGATHVLQIAYQDTTPETWVQGHARILIAGELLTELHNGQDNEFLDGIGFEFVPASETATLRIEALPGDSESFLIDDIRITLGSLPPAPAESWSNLTVMADARGGRRLVNGTFETAIVPAASDPFNSGPDGGPHLCRFSLPGWLVTQENIDLIVSGGAQNPEGTVALDLGGHGPGGVAQTITGLPPESVYTLSFHYARHFWWGPVLTADILANGVVVESLSRDESQKWDSGYELGEVPLLSNAQGELHVELRSTTIDQGGGIIFDDIRLSEGGDAFLAWARANEVSEDPEANPDSDPFTQEFEFLLGLNPDHPDPLIVPSMTEGQIILDIPLAGAAIDQGYQLDLEVSDDLDEWDTAAASGVLVTSDSSSANQSGVRRYLLPAGHSSLFVRLLLSRP